MVLLLFYISDSTYDVVVVDACDQDSEVPCPVKQFISQSTLRNVKKILKSRGK